MEIPPELWPALLATFGLFLLVGFFAQLVDGAVGMAYGVISSSVLLAFGVPPAQVSATIHAAECFTTGASGTSHLLHKNVDWRLLLRLAPAGIVGGVIGAYLLTGFEPTFIKAFIVAYLGILGLFLLFRAIRGPREEPPHLKHVIPLGVAGGFLDASGGGGWGPIVTTTLLGRGHAPRYAIGSVNTAEFFVTVAISATFIWTMMTGRMVIEGGIGHALAALGGLVLGGLVAAPLAGYVTKIAPARLLLGAAAVLVISLSIWQGIQLWPKLLDEPILTQFFASR
ncbi:sulfite exporter TauE/SafE family protein [Vitreimonas flagellata]|uniref:sulfite exporter TauE/SafE family protein n=1 Tax=Vitreimonas flagellata TaxID=2560861 RepID=UPI001EF891BC|nr:sulfite exporter TauE/SafE family protein [Vitreimonas flagellata]